MVSVSCSACARETPSISTEAINARCVTEPKVPSAVPNGPLVGFAIPSPDFANIQCSTILQTEIIRYFQLSLTALCVQIPGCSPTAQIESAIHWPVVGAWG